MKAWYRKMVLRWPGNVRRVPVRRATWYWNEVPRKTWYYIIRRPLGRPGIL